MSAFNNTNNYTNSNIRRIIVAVANEFSNKINYDLYKSENDFETIYVPFFNSFTGSEDFLKDNFLNDDLVNSQQKLDGMYNKIPRGILTFNSLEIDSGSLVNKYTRVEIPKKVDATTYKIYSYETLILPVNLTFDAKILCSSTLEMLKILEHGLLKYFYKSTPFMVDFGGYRIQGYISIQDSTDMERQIEFSYSDRKTYDIIFSVDVSAHLPLYRDGSEMFIGNRMGEIQMNLYDFDYAPNRGLFSNTANSVTGYENNKFN